MTSRAAAMGPRSRASYCPSRRVCSGVSPLCSYAAKAPFLHACGRAGAPAAMQPRSAGQTQGEPSGSTDWQRRAFFILLQQTEHLATAMISKHCIRRLALTNSSSVTCFSGEAASYECHV